MTPTPDPDRDAKAILALIQWMGQMNDVQTLCFTLVVCLLIWGLIK